MHTLFCQFIFVLWMLLVFNCFTIKSASNHPLYCPCFDWPTIMGLNITTQAYEEMGMCHVLYTCNTAVIVHCQFLKTCIVQGWCYRSVTSLPHERCMVFSNLCFQSTTMCLPEHIFAYMFLNRYHCVLCMCNTSHSDMMCFPMIDNYLFCCEDLKTT